MDTATDTVGQEAKANGEKEMRRKRSKRLTTPALANPGGGLLRRQLANPLTPMSDDDRIELLSYCLSKGEKNAAAMDGQDVVFVLGNTGAGKSTLINYLCGCRMESVRRKNIGLSGRGSVIRVKADQRDTAVADIGHDTQKSATFLPSVAVSTVDRQVYCDCPGFLDNRGPEINIANAVNTRAMLLAARSVKLLVLINYDSIKADRGRGLQDMVRILLQMFASEQALQQHQDSILLGVSRYPLKAAGDEAGDLADLRVDFFPRAQQASNNKEDTAKDDEGSETDKGNKGKAGGSRGISKGDGGEDEAAKAQQSLPPVLRPLVDRVFVYDPLDRPFLSNCGLTHETIVSTLARMPPIGPSSGTGSSSDDGSAAAIFQTVLTPEDTLELMRLCADVSERAHKHLKQKEWAAAVTCVTRLQQLKPIAHPCVNQQLLHSSARFERHFVQQREDCRDLIFSDKFDEAERMIVELEEAAEAAKGAQVFAITVGSISSVDIETVVDVAGLREQLERRRQALAAQKEREREQGEQLQQARNDLKKMVELRVEDRKRQAAELKEMQERHLQQQQERAQADKRHQEQIEAIQAANQENIDRRLQEHMEAMEKRSKNWFRRGNAKTKEMEQIQEQLEQERAALTKQAEEEKTAYLKEQEEKRQAREQQHRQQMAAKEAELEQAAARAAVAVAAEAKAREEAEEQRRRKDSTMLEVHIEPVEDLELLAVLQKLCTAEDASNFGKGADYRGGAHAGAPRVARAWHIDNQALDTSYHSGVLAVKRTCRDKPPQPLRLKHHFEAACDKLSAHEKKPLRADINEKFLLHAPSHAAMHSILHSGFNEHFAGSNAGTAFGEGCYFAEDIAKADQYAKVDSYYQGSELHEDLYPIGDHPGDVYYVLVSRVVLGHSIEATSAGKRNKPWFALGGTNAKELANIPNVTPPTPYHSLLGTAFPRFREFIVFKPRQYVRPLYLIAYCRGGPEPPWVLLLKEQRVREATAAEEARIRREGRGETLEAVKATGWRLQDSGSGSSSSADTNGAAAESEIPKIMWVHEPTDGSRSGTRTNCVLMDVANREGKQQHRFDVTGGGGEAVQLAAPSDARKREWVGVVDAGGIARREVAKAAEDLGQVLKERWQMEDTLMLAKYGASTMKYDVGVGTTEADFSNKKLDASDAISVAAFLSNKCKCNNNIGQLVLPEGWSEEPNMQEMKVEYKHTDGTVQEAHPGKPEGVIALADGIKNNGAMVSVNILNNDIGTEQAQNLVTILKEHATLVSLCGNKGDEAELDMSGKNMGADGAIMLVPEIIANAALTSLNISSNNIGEMTLPEGWRVYGRYAADGRGHTGYAVVYKHTDGRGQRSPPTGSKPEGAIALANAISAKNSGALTHLDISNQTHEMFGRTFGGIGAEGAKAIAEALKSNGAMVTVNVMGNKIGKEQLSKLQEMMQAHPMLVSLCGIADDATEANLSGLGMDADDAVVLADELPAKGALMIFDISKNQLYAAGGEAIAEALAGNQVMTELNIAGNDLGKIDFFNADMSMSGVIAISNAIPTMGALTSLNMSDNQLGGYEDCDGFWISDMTGIKALAAAIPTCKALAKFTFSVQDRYGNEGPRVTMETSMVRADFSNKGLGASGAMMLAAFLPKCQALASLDLSQNSIPAEEMGPIERLCQSKQIALRKLKL
eukprot:g1097.t1